MYIKDKLACEVVDLHKYMRKCLTLLNEGKRNNMCKQFCWSARGNDYIKTAPFFQDIDIDFPIKSIIDASKHVIYEYFGIKVKPIILKKKSANKYHIYYINVFNTSCVRYTHVRVLLCFC